MVDDLMPNGLLMIDALRSRLLRYVPLAAYAPLRRAVHRHSRGHPVRLAATVALRRALAAHRGYLPGRLQEICPLDAPELSFEASDSMVMDAVYWFGVRGYEGTVSPVWTALCSQARNVLEIGGNVGLFTVLGARACAGAYTVVEPLPSNAAVIRANLVRNGLLTVDMREAAVVPDGEARFVTLNVPDEGRDAPVGAHLLDGVEVAGRSSLCHVTAWGLPMADLATGRDLIKIDAEGIEAALLDAIRPHIAAHRPALVVEVLPDSKRLAALLRVLALTHGYQIHALPEWGLDAPVPVAADTFTAAVPAQHNGKDVVLTIGALPR